MLIGGARHHVQRDHIRSIGDDGHGPHGPDFPVPVLANSNLGSPPQRQKRTDASILCPRSPPAGPVLPHIPRPHLRTGAAARLPAPETRRRPRPSLHAPLLQWHPLLLSACAPARLVHALAPACANHPPPPRRPACGGGQATPSGGHPLPQSSLLHHRL